mmetsp:Transcript_188/g.524  ORF Transcript_188/g.524 Transcript_188/m.524 type:complete len:319 (-) Transcript_188:546-1502(-)
MSCWLIEQQNVGAHQHSPDESKLHLPAARKVADLTLQLQVVKTNASQSGNHLLLRHAHGLDSLIGEDVLQRGPLALRLFLANAVLDKSRDKLALGRESIHLLIVDGSQQRAFPAIVGAAKSVALPPLEMKPCVVQKSKCPVSQREDTVAQVFTFFIEILHVISFCSIIATFQQIRHQVLAVLVRENRWGKVWRNALPPLRILEASAGADAGAERGHVVRNQFTHQLHLLSRDFLLEHVQDCGFADEATPVCLFCSLEGTVTATGHVAHLGIRDVVRGLLHQRDQRRQERLNLGHIRDQLAHVVCDDQGTALGPLVPVF